MKVLRIILDYHICGLFNYKREMADRTFKYVLGYAPGVGILALGIRWQEAFFIIFGAALILFVLTLVVISENKPKDP